MITDMVKAFKEKIKKGIVFGIFSQIPEPAVVEIMGYTGFDFVILDMEHGPGTLENMQNMIRAAQVSQILPIVRVKNYSPSLIGDALDMGAGGIQIPQVRTAEDVKKVIELSKYSPKGMRGVCPYVRSTDYYSGYGSQYYKEANDTLVIIQIEGKEGIENLDEIINVEGYDILFVGPYDLSQSLGFLGEINHPLVQEKGKEIIKKCSKKGIFVGNFTDGDITKETLMWINLGVRFVSYNTDSGIFYNCCKNILKNLKNISNK